MCGILGIASRSGVRERDWLEVGTQNMAHRGPDDAGHWWSATGQVGFGHRRLAIVDLSRAGHQPMHRGTQGTTIVFNGEIYNFLDLRRQLAESGEIFVTHSDTEVILAAYKRWGVDCVTHFNGAFAFAIYDTVREQVFLARDRAGEKPLFFRHADGTLRFASELKGLLADLTLPRRINPQALHCYLSVGYVPGDLCILDGYQKLPPGHAMVFNLNNGNLRQWQYWALPEYDPEIDSSKDKDIVLLDELETLLQDAVGKQLMADVPVGVLLSGGVDSSLVTAMAVRNSDQVRTFSVGFPGYGQLDETEHARRIAKHFGTQHTELVPEPTHPELLYELAKQFDEPIVDSSMIPTYLVSRLVKQHCTVALGGDGGDELFGGYSHYSRLQWMQKRLRVVPLALRRFVGAAASRFIPPGVKGRNWLQGLAVDLDSSLPLVAAHFDAVHRRQLLNFTEGSLSAEAIMLRRMSPQSDLVQRMTRMDFSNYLPEDILVKVDRASMLNSLEVRAPFLDYRLIEFAYRRVPSRLKATPEDKKILLKQLCTRVLPSDFDKQRKQGFSIPLAQWLKTGHLRDLFQDVLVSSDSSFDQAAVKRLLAGQERGRGNSQRLFALVMFELWRKEYGAVLH